MRQESVLLRAVEPMDFVDEQDCPFGLELFPVSGSLYDLAQFWNSSQDCAERNEVGLGGATDYVGQSRLAGPGFTPQEQRRQPILSDGAVEDRSFTYEVLLPDDLGELSGAHPLRQRWLGVAELSAFGGGFNQRATARLGIGSFGHPRFVACGCSGRYPRSPKIAEPTLTSVAPSSIATSKSRLMP